MNDARDRFVASVVQLLLGACGTFVLSFGTLVLLARWFPPEFVACVKAGTILGGWIVVIASLQMHASFVYHYKQGDGAEAEALRVGMIRWFLAGAILAGIAYVLAFPFFFQSELLRPWGLVGFGVTTAINVLYYVTPSFYTAVGENRNLAMVVIGQPAGALIALLASRAMGWGVNGFGICQAVVAIGLIAVSRWRTFVWAALTAPWTRREMLPRPILAYGTRISAAMVLESMGDRTDKLVAARVLPEAAFGKYSIVCFENPMVGLLLNSYGLALFKEFQSGVGGRTDEFHRMWREMIEAVTLLTFPVSVLLCLNAQLFITLVFGDAVSEMSLVFTIYLLVTLIRFAPFQMLLRIEGFTHLNVVIAAIFVLLAGLTAIVLAAWDAAPQYYALSYAAGWVGFNIGAVLLFTRKTGMSFAAVVQPWLWLKRVAQCAVAAVVGITAFGRDSYLGFLTGALAYALILAVTDPFARTSFRKFRSKLSMLRIKHREA